MSPGLIEATLPEHVSRLAPARRLAGNLKQNKMLQTPNKIKRGWVGRLNDDKCYEWI